MVYELLKQQEITAQERFRLFHFAANNGIKIQLDISCEQQYFKTSLFPNRDTYGSFPVRKVYFTFCDIDFDNNFEAMSVVTSMLDMFKKKILQPNSTFKMRYDIPEKGAVLFMCALFSPAGASPSARKDSLLELGLMSARTNDDTRVSIHFNHAYVFHLRNALYRAMNWLTPDSALVAQEYRKSYSKYPS